MKQLLVISLLSLSLFSCADFNRDQLLHQVAKEQKKLSQLNAQLAANVISDVATLKNNTMQTELRIKQNLHLDTINLELAKQLEEFKLMRKSLKPLMKQYLKARKGIDEEKKVLNNLKRDVQDGRGERQRYAEYIRFEKQKVQQLQELTNDYLRSRAQFYQDYHRLFPPVEAFSRTLIQKHRN